MAKLDDLIARVSDDELRDHLASSAAELRRHTRFGLVFEQHIPETALLPEFPLKPGTTVYKKDDSASRREYVVESVSRRTATIIPSAHVTQSAAAASQNGKGKATKSTGSKAEKVKVDELLVLKGFGEPVFPTLTPVGQLHRGGGKPPHAAINGENYHALQLLVHLYEGQFDCIYVDPPYNTGARDWKYNNHYVDGKDKWRHSKWLSFMEKRLRLARMLLKEDGILIVTIDEHEVHHLGMLLEQIFPDYLRHMVSIVVNPKGTGKHNFARVDEYAIFCVPNLGRSVIVGEPTVREPNGAAPTEEETLLEPDEAEDVPVEKADPADARTYPFPLEELPHWELRHARRRGGESSYRHQRPNQFYPIYIDEEAEEVVGVGKAPASLDVEPSFRRVRGLKPIWPIDDEGNERCWRYVPKSMAELIEQNRVVLGRYNPRRDSWTVNYWVRRPDTRKHKTVWWEKPHDAGTHGTTLLHGLLGRRDAFSFPKSVYAVSDCLAAVVRDRPNAMILDFFAGSGTTFHATCLLNAEDGGERRCILVTNNEVPVKVERALHKQGHYRGDPKFETNGIFEQATRPRCEAVVTGRRPDTKEPLEGKHVGGRPFADGFEENIDFYRLAYLDPDEVELGLRFKELLPLLRFRSGSPGSKAKPDHKGDFFLPEGEPFGVLLKESRYRPFVEALLKRPDVTDVWLVTDNERAFSEMSRTLPPGLNAWMLYSDYIEYFRRNGG